MNSTANSEMSPTNFAELRLQKLQQLRAAKQRLHDLEVERSRRIDVFAELGYVPTARQEVFHAATEFSVLYGGAAGGGKTKALVAEGIRKAVQYPGVRIGAFRRTYGELEESLLAELAAYGYASVLGAKWNQTEKNLTFPNGSLVMFRYAENMLDATRRQGGQYQLLLFDEMTLTDPRVIRFLSSRLRTGKSNIPVLGMRAGTNPGGVGHGWVKDTFIDPTDGGEKVHVDERGRTVRFIPAKIDDNPHLNPEYAEDLNTLDEATRAAMRDGSWTSFSGQVFSVWRDEKHIVPASIELPASWLRYGGLDYGWTAPSAYELMARDEDGRVWLYGELTMTQTPEADQAKRVLALEGSNPPALRAADPAMWGKTSSALPVAVTYAQEGAPLRKADNDRLSGKARVHSYLEDGPACRYHRELGWATCPRLHVLSGAAPELVRTLPNLVYDKNRIEDVDTHGEDHHYDALRYALMSIGSTATLVLDGPTRDPIVPEDQQLVEREGIGWQHEDLWRAPAPDEVSIAQADELPLELVNGPVGDLATFREDTDQPEQRPTSQRAPWLQ